MQTYDVVVVGAGAAGLMCAATAGQRGLRVLLVDHAVKVAEKIRISGGGRCNFTNRDLDVRAPHKHYLGANPAFARSALSRYTPQDFIALLERHGVPYHEKHKGQLFCDRSAQDVIDVLLKECEAGEVHRWQPCSVQSVDWSAQTLCYTLQTQRGQVQTAALVVATGGLPVPKIGATDWGLRVAKQFGLGVVEPRPALVPLTFASDPGAATKDDPPLNPADLAGLSLPVRIRTGDVASSTVFDEDLLFTHKGLSGPAVLQISSYWQAGQALTVDLLPDVDLAAVLIERKTQSKKSLRNVLGQHMPQRLADAWLTGVAQADQDLPNCPDKVLRQLAQRVHAWRITPKGTEGYAKAEVMAGGVNTRDLSQQSMMAKQQPGLYFIGEVVDITGWLGGYNFQWAWASAQACAKALPGT